MCVTGYTEETFIEMYEALDDKDRLMVRELVLRLRRRSEGAAPKVAKTLRVQVLEE